MNCRSVQTWLLSDRDGVLTPAQHAELATHLAACADCRQLRADVEVALDAVRADAKAVRLPDIDAEWRAVQARINTAASASAPRTTKRRLAPVVWFGTPLAAAAAVALALFVGRPVPPAAPSTMGATEATAQADYVEVADPNATPIVYTDKESGWLVVWAESADTTHASG